MGAGAGALAAGDLLVVSSDPAMLLRYRAADVAAFVAALRAQPPNGTPPAGLSPDVLVHPPQSSVAEERRFPAGAAPSGVAIGPDGNLLVPTSDGAVLIFTPDGERRGDGFGGFVDFAQGLGNGKFKIAVGPQAGRFRAFLADRNGGEVLRFTIGSDGTGALDATVTSGIESPVGIATTTSNTVSTPARSDVLVSPTVVLETLIPQVLASGLTHAKVLLVEDPREKEQSIPTGQPMHRALLLDEIADDLPPVEIPAYVRSFRLGDPETGPPTFILVVADTTAELSGVIVHLAEEATILGYEPDCQDLDPSLQPRLFWAPTPEEPPILEGASFIDVTAGCGSDRGITRNSLSLFLPGCRDTRAPIDVARAKLDRLEELFAASTCITKKVRSNLERELESARRSFDRGRHSTAIKDLTDFSAIASAHPEAFGGCGDTLAAELVAHAGSAAFTLGLL